MTKTSVAKQINNLFFKRLSHREQNSTLKLILSKYRNKNQDWFSTLNFIEKLIELPWENGTFVISHLVRISGLKTEVIITGYKKFYKIDS